MTWNLRDCNVRPPFLATIQRRSSMLGFAPRLVGLLNLALSVVFVLHMAHSAHAQEVAGAEEDESLVVVRAARMLDVASGEIVPDAVVVVEGDRIRDVGAGAAPAGARTIDLGDV